MAKVELKKPVVDEISANLEGAAGVVLVDHCGLTVEQDTQLRKQMRAEGIVYKVYKNTMLNFAIKGTEFEPLAQHLEGPSAIAISKTDATAPARIVANFAKKAEKLEIKAGVVEGNYYDAKGMTAIANVPSREVLLGKLLCVITHGKINPLIGSAGVSAVPMAARVSQKVGAEEDPTNFLLMHAMGPNVAGVIGTAVAAGTFMAIFGI